MSHIINNNLPVFMKKNAIEIGNYSFPTVDVFEIESEGIFCASNGAGEDLDPNPDEIG